MRAVSTNDAPSSIGPYSQGIEVGNLVFVSGQGAAEPELREVVSDDIEDQAEQVMKNISAVLEASGTSLENVVKAAVFLTDMSNYDIVNKVYGRYMSEPYPARSAVEVSDLPIDAGVEIEVIAEKS